MTAFTDQAVNEIKNKTVLNIVMLLNQFLDIETAFYYHIYNDKVYLNQQSKGEQIATYIIGNYYSIDGLDISVRNHYTRQYIGAAKIPMNKVEDFIRSGKFCDMYNYVRQSHNDYIKQRNDYVAKVRSYRP